MSKKILTLLAVILMMAFALSAMACVGNNPGTETTAGSDSEQGSVEDTEIVSAPIPEFIETIPPEGGNGQ